MTRRSGISLFLIELVVMITVFVTAAAIDTLMLVKANNLAKDSSDLNRAVEYAVSAAESFKATGGGSSAGMELKDGVWQTELDKNWQCAKAGGKYTVSMTVEGVCAKVDVFRDGESIYSLTAGRADYEK